MPLSVLCTCPLRFHIGIQIWSCTSPSNFSTLVVKEKVAIRLIHGACYNSHTEPLFKNSSIFLLHALIDYFKLQFMYSYFNNLLPQSFKSMWTVNAERRPGENVPTLRSHNDLFLPTSRLVSTEKFPLLSFPRIWTNLQEINIKESSSLPHFNCNLKNISLTNFCQIIPVKGFCALTAI